MIIAFKSLHKCKLGTHCYFALGWMSPNPTNKKSWLVQVMAWCRQGTQAWANTDSRFRLSYGIYREKVWIFPPNIIIVPRKKFVASVCWAEKTRCTWWWPASAKPHIQCVITLQCRARQPCLRPGPWFNIKMSSYQYRKSHCGDKTVVRSSYLHNGNSYIGKMSSLYWIGALMFSRVYVIKMANTCLQSFHLKKRVILKTCQLKCISIPQTL